MKTAITEYLEIDLDNELWCCRRCNQELGPARQPYKKFLLVAERDPREVHLPYVKEEQGFSYTLAPDPDWCRLIEYYCPNCACLVEVEYLPPGHPIINDIEIDIDSLRKKYLEK